MQTADSGLLDGVLAANHLLYIYYKISQFSKGQFDNVVALEIIVVTYAVEIINCEENVNHQIGYNVE